MKTELNTILATLKTQFNALETEYVDECAVDFMSRRATYLDGQLAMLYQVIGLLDGINTDLEVEQVLDDYDPSDFDFEMDDEVDEADEIGYDPYMGCNSWDC